MYRFGLPGRGRSGSIRLVALVVVGIVVGSILGYAVASSFQQKNLTQTTNLYGVTFNASGLPEFPYFPITTLPPGAVAHVTAPTLDGSGSATPAGANPASLSVTFTTSHRGDLLLLALSTDHEATPTLTASAVTDTFGLSWAFAAAPVEFITTGGSSPAYLYLFYALEGSVSGSETISVSFSSDSVKTASEVAFGFSGVNVASPWDTGGPQRATGTGNSATASIIAAQRSDAILDVVAITGAQTVSPTSGFAGIGTQVAKGNDFTGYAEYDRAERAAGSGPFTVSPTWPGGTQNWGIILAGIRGIPSLAPLSPTIEYSAFGQTTGGNPASLSVDLATSVPNDLLVLSLTTAGEKTPTLTSSSVSDSFGLTWSEEGSPLKFIATGGISPAYQYLFYSLSGTATGTDVVTVSFSSDALSAAATIGLAMTGVNPQTPWDGSAQTATGTGTTASASITTTYGNDTLLGFLSIANSVTVAQSVGWTTLASQVQSGNDFTQNLGYQSINATGTNTASPSWSGGALNFGIVVAAVEGTSGFRVPSPLSSQPCESAFSFPGGSGAQSPYPVFVNATGSGSVCGVSTQNYMFEEWILLTNQSNRLIPAGTYFFNFTFAWLPYNGRVVNAYSTTITLTVGAGGQTNGPAIYMYLIFGNLPLGPVPGSVLPTIQFIGCAVAP